MYPGVVIGFSPFTELPSIEICYVKKGYSEADLVITTFNEKSSIEIVKAVDDLPVQQADVVAWFDRQRTKKELEIADLETKKQYFVRWFGSTMIEVPAEDLPST